MALARLAAPVGSGCGGGDTVWWAAVVVADRGEVALEVGALVVPGLGECSRESWDGGGGALVRLEQQWGPEWSEFRRKRVAAMATVRRN